MIRIAPSILSADFARLGEEIRDVAQKGADWIHVDVMDGHFVPNMTIGVPVVKSIRPCTELPLDVHLMIENPDFYIPDFAAAGADMITVHVEACRHLHRTVELIKQQGKKAGLALNPATPVTAIEPMLPFADLVLIMTVNPGFGGQQFISMTLKKIKQLRSLLAERGLKHIDIEVDGGINEQTAAAVAAAGANVFVAGNAIFTASDRAAAIAGIRRAAMQTVKR
ncbi:MAG TPA: ribulose-phosphate 3-epimerase [Bacilli bacterium]